MIKDAYGNTRFFGTYRGVVVDTSDPLNQNRVKLRIPQVLANEVTDWAWFVNTPGNNLVLPKAGDGVWVQFEGGDPSYPIWIGTFDPIASTLTAGTTGATGATAAAGQTGVSGCYGAFQYTGSQTATTTTAQAFPWNTTDFSGDIYTSNTSRVYFPTAGLYNIQWSGQFENSSNALEDISVWLRINGADVPGSTGFISIPARKSAGNPAHMIVGWNYFLQFTAGQYLEVMWAASNTTVTLQSYAAGTTPTTPTTAALILTANQIA